VLFFLKVVAFVLMGSCLGVMTGCTPGIHVNMVSILVVGIYASSTLEPILFATLVLSMAVVQTFLDILPAIFLGAPDPDTALSILPGHRMLLQGRGFEAVRLSAMGSLGAVMLAAGMALPMIVLIPAIYPVLSAVLFPLLLFLEASIIITEKTCRKMLFALGVIALSGFLGVLITSSGFMPTDKALFPALSGLFGISTLLLSSESGVEIPDQELDVSVDMDRLRMAKSIVVGFFAGMTTGILPAVGSAQATILAQRVTRESDHRSFIVAVSGVNTGNMIFGLIALYTIGKARNGAVKAVQAIIGEGIDFNTLILFIGVVLFCGGIGAILTRIVGGVFAKNITRLPYTLLARGIVCMITVLVAIVSGPRGLLVLFVSTFIGFLPPLLGVKRVHSMGFLMIPTLIYFSGFRSLLLGLLNL
jgi:putative membrane protein